MFRRTIFAICLFVVGTMVSTVAAKSERQEIHWAPVQRVPFYDEEASTPFMIVDNGQVHAFNSTRNGSEVVVVYSSWQPVAGWTRSVDIVLSPQKQQARLGGVHLDSNGVFHLVFFGGDELGANIYYTQAPAADVRQASAWSSPQTVGRQAITPELSTIIGAPNGELVIVFSSNIEGQGLYYTQSDDRGQSWSDPMPFFFTYSNALWPVHHTQLVDQGGDIHLAWAVANLTGNSQAIYYSRYDRATKQWKQPERLAVAFGFEADTPRLFEHDGQLFIVFHNDVPTTRWMRRSTDNGDNWSEPVKVHPNHVGSNGPPTVIVDSSDQLHMFFGNRTGSNTHGMWHTTWEGSAWAKPSPVVSGPRVEDFTTGQGFDPSDATAALVQGHYVLLTWTTDPGAGLNGVWFTYTDLGTPTVTEEAFPDAPATPVMTPTVLSEALAETETPAPELPPFGPEDTNESSIADYMVGLIPVLVLVSAVFIVTIVRSRRFP